MLWGLNDLCFSKVCACCLRVHSGSRSDEVWSRADRRAGSTNLVTCNTQVPEGASRPDVYYSHPEPWPARHTEQLAAHYGGRVFLCGSETDTSHPGYIEGAVRTGKKGAEAVQDVVAATCRA